MGYVHDTGFAQWVPPTAAFGDTAAWTFGAGQVANSIVQKCDATDETANLFIPILLPSNSGANKGALLKSIEIDYEIVTAACDAVTFTVYKMTRGASGAAVTVGTVTVTASLDATAAKAADQLKQVLTLSTPAYIDNDEYYWVKIAFDKAATSTVEFLGAVANYTLRA